MRLELKAKHFACSRTKNRLREHSNFVATKPPQPCAFDPSGEKWLHVVETPTCLVPSNFHLARSFAPNDPSPVSVEGLNLCKPSTILPTGNGTRTAIGSARNSTWIPLSGTTGDASPRAPVPDSHTDTHRHWCRSR